MIDAYQSMSVWICDTVAGWTLLFPRDMTVILLGVLLGLFLIAIRWLTIDRNFIRQIVADEHRLRDLIRNARADKDRERLARYRAIRALVRGRRARAEFLSVCTSLLILVGVMSWGQERLEYHPIRSGESFTFRVQVPASAVGEIIHVVPLDNLTTATGWIREIEPGNQEHMAIGKAEWSLQMVQASSNETITLRLGNRTIDHTFTTDQTRYLSPLRHHEGLLNTEVVHQPYRPFGWIPHHVMPGLPGWSLLMMATSAGVFFGLRHGSRDT